MRWSEFYDNIEDFAIETAKAEVRNLSDIGTGDEIVDVMYYFEEDSATVTMLVDMAVEAQVRFSGDNLVSIKDCCGQDSFKRALECSAPFLKKDDVECLYGCIEDRDFIDLVKRHHLTVPAYILEEFREQLEDASTPISWKKFYDSFWNWSEDYARERIQSVTSFGKGEDVAETLLALYPNDTAGADVLLLRALDSGTCFKAEDIDAVCCFCSEAALQKVFMASCTRFKNKDLEDLCGVVPDEWIIQAAKSQGLRLPEDLFEYDELVDDGNNIPISWERFYENYEQWSEEFARRKLEEVTEFGTPDEIVEVMNVLYLTDEIGASDFLKRVLDAGITFSVYELTEIAALCNEEMIHKAIMASGGNLSDEDLEELYGVADDESLEQVAEMFNLMLPEDLREDELDDEEETIYLDVGDMKLQLSSTIEWADLAIHALVQANNCMNNAGNWGVVDMFGGGFFSSFVKHTSAEEAEQWINQAQGYLECMNNGLEVILQNKASHLQFSALEIAVDMLLDDSFMDCLVQLHIGKVKKQIGKAIRQVESVRNELVKSYKQL